MAEVCPAPPYASLAPSAKYNQAEEQKMTAQAHWAPSDGVTACKVETGDGAMVVDVDAEAGGDPTHPSPHDLLDASLAACTTLTLQLYIKRKAWALPHIHTVVTHTKDTTGYVMNRSIDFGDAVTPDQLVSLLRIADACPVHKTLTGNISIVTVARKSA
jgi:putative redox protein